MSRQLVFLMPRIDQNIFSPEELLARQDVYASYLAKEQGAEFYKAIAIYSGTKKPLKVEGLSSIEPIWIGSSNLPTLQFFLNSLRKLKKIKDKKLVFVAGTPFQPLLIARLLSICIRNSAIQVSIHGELASIKKVRSKYYFLKSQLKRVSGLRFVSQNQMNDFVKEFGVLPIPTVVTPVPIKLGTTSTGDAGRCNLGFVGRIHEERDPLAWVEIANSIPEMKKLVIGDGPLLETMKGALHGGIFLGVLERLDLEKAWSRITILLSTAPYESYGLTVREALLHEVPVVARSSAGVLELASKFPKLIRLFDDPREAVSLIRDFETSPPQSDDYQPFKEWFAKEQNKSLVALAKLWASI